MRWQARGALRHGVILRAIVIVICVRGGTELEFRLTETNKLKCINYRLKSQLRTRSRFTPDASSLSLDAEGVMRHI